MEQSPDRMEIELACVIVNNGCGSKVLRIAKQHGIPGGTVLFGKGTVKNRFLEFLDLCDVRKEIVLLIAEQSIMDTALLKLDKEFQFKKPNHGIAFTLPVAAFLGTGHYNYSYTTESRGEKPIMYNSIFVIVEKGKGELVVETAAKSGARGGTIINARGSGIHETSKLFHMEIEPEKEIVLILTEAAITEQIVTSLRNELEVDKPGNGIIFVQEVRSTYGVLK